jgi:beta-xylosidase
VPTGWQVVLRSRTIYGPYERRVVLQQGDTPTNGPHQGAWVDTGTGEDWFLHFQDRGWLGRVVHLEPMRWVDDWPAIGDMTHGAIGQPVLTHRKPRTLRSSSLVNPVDSDEFNDTAIGPQWSWQGNPKPNWAFSSKALGVLSMVSIPPVEGATDLWTNPAVLLSKAPAESFTVTTLVRTHFKSVGDRAGLVLLGKTYGYAEVVLTAKGLALREVMATSMDNGGKERVASEVSIAGTEVQLRMTVDKGNVSFGYSEDGKHFAALGNSYIAQPGIWVGAKVGLFSAGETQTGTFGYVDYDWLRFTALPSHE